MMKANRQILTLIIGVLIQKLLEFVLMEHKNGPEHRT